MTPSPAIRLRPCAGFTLVELVAVVAILAVLAGTAAPLFSRAVLETERGETVERMARMDAAVLSHLADTGRLPTSLPDLLTESAPTPGWCGPYLPDRFTRSLGMNRDSPDGDAWGRPFGYQSLTASSARLWSAGRDGITGNEDDLVRTIEGTPVLRAETKERLRVLNSALLAFLRQYRPGADLPSSVDFEAMRATLIARGFLNADSRYRLDAWGNLFTTDPAPSPARPVCRFRSPRL